MSAVNMSSDAITKQTMDEMKEISSIIKENISKKEYFMAWFNFYFESGDRTKENMLKFYQDLYRYAEHLVEDTSDLDLDGFFNKDNSEFLAMDEKYSQMLKDPTSLPDGKTFGVTVSDDVKRIIN